MDRIAQAKKLYAQARKTTVSLALSVVAYGVVGYFLIQREKAGPALLNGPQYGWALYAALFLSAAGLFAMWQVGARMSGSFSSVQITERLPQKIFLRTLLMSAGAELPVFLGMLLMFFGRRPFDYLPFAMLSLAGFWLAFPRKQQWAEWLGTDF